MVNSQIVLYASKKKQTSAMKPLFSLYSFLRKKNKLQCLNNFSVPIDATIKKKNYY